MHDASHLDSMNDKCFGKYLKAIHEITGITISPNRKSMVQGRVRKRILQLGLPSYEAYLERVQADHAEQEIFIDLVTTNETYFFRTPRIWDYIADEFLPQWHQKHPRKIFNAWSAASSSGEEAHSIGIVCQEFKDKNPAFAYKVLGTDISQEMVALCQQGYYSHRSIESFRSLRPAYFHRFMVPVDKEQFQAIPEVRARMRFHQHNLFKPHASGELHDLILLRNVLIYFTQADQEKVLQNIHAQLADDGVLIIGESESLTHIHADFKPVEPLIYKKGTRNSIFGKSA